MKYKIILLLALVNIPFNAWSEEILIFADKNTIYPLSKRLVSMKKASITTITPHRALNPNRNAEVYSGYTLGEIFNNKCSQSKYVYAVGDDDYPSAIPLKNAHPSAVILATEKNNQSISRRDGGIQIIYDTHSDRISETVKKKAAHWCWYVSSLICDTHQFQLRSKIYLEKYINNKTFPQDTASVYKKPSIFIYENQDCPKITVNNLSSDKLKSLSFLTLSGKKINLSNGELQSIAILSKDNLEPLPIECGGPYLIIRHDKSNQKIQHSYVWEINASNSL